MDEENKKTIPTSETTNNTESEVKEVPKTEPQKVETKSTNNTTNTTTNQTKPKKKKKGFIISIIIIILAIIAGAIGGVIYALFLSKTEIELAKYITIEFEGYEGYASFNKDDLVINEKELKKVLDDKSLAKKLSNKLLDKAEVKENDNLKNGDEIEVKFKISESWLEENKIKLTSNSIKIKVANLEEPDSIDLFKDLEFSYSGISPNLTVSLKNNSKDDFIKNKVTFSMETEKSKYSSSTLYDAANGDKVTVTAKYSQSDLEEAGYIVENENYEFTIKDQAEYIKKVDGLTKEVRTIVEAKLLAKAKDIANSSDYNVAKAYHEDFNDISHYDYKFTHNDPVLTKMYIALNKDFKNMGYSEYTNIVYGIYKVTYTDTTTSKTYDYFITTQVENLVADTKGLYSNKTYYYSEFSNYNFKTSDGNDYHKSTDEIVNAIKNKIGTDNYDLTEVK